MKITFKILSGARAGRAETLAKSYIAIGRHPLSDLRFDAEGDLDVSTRHAAVLERGGEYVLRDLESRNGTFVNGVRLTDDRVLRDGDVLRFGLEGPTAECTIDRQATVEPGAAVPPPAAVPQAQQPGAAKRRAPKPGATTRIKAEVAKQTQTLRRTTGVLTLLLVVVLVGAVVVTVLERRARRAELVTLTARADSIQREAQATIAALQFEVEGLADAFRSAETQARQLKTQLQAVSAADRVEVDRLRDALTAAQARQRSLLSAANMDYQQIAQDNRRAVAIVLVEFTPSDRIAGTAFGVRADRVLVTARHVVAGPDGTRRPTRIAVKFTDSNQWFRGEVLTLSRTADLALVRAQFRGTAPTIPVGGSTPPPEVGDPIAVLGFPLGLDLPMVGEGLEAYAAPTLTLGTVTKTLPTILQIDGYGAEGASGSPVFDAAGRLLGVVTSGQPESGGRIVFAERVEAFAALLAGLDPYTGRASGPLRCAIITLRAHPPRLPLPFHRPSRRTAATSHRTTAP